MFSKFIKFQSATDFHGSTRIPKMSCRKKRCHSERSEEPMQFARQHQEFSVTLSVCMKVSIRANPWLGFHFPRATAATSSLLKSQLMQRVVQIRCPNTFPHRGHLHSVSHHPPA